MAQWIKDLPLSLQWLGLLLWCTFYPSPWLGELRHGVRHSQIKKKNLIAEECGGRGAEFAAPNYDCST